jgi:flavin-binding protein dodecin
MSDSVYKIIELVGSSKVSWEDAAKNAIEKASGSLRDLRIAEVLAQDIHMKDGKIDFYRTKIKLSFKYHA